MKKVDISTLKGDKLKKAMEATSTAAGETARTIAAVAALPILAGVVQYLTTKKNIKQEINELRSSYQQVLSMNSSLKSQKELADERFHELSAIAPTIAKNPKMAAKVIEPRLQSGFSVDDVHKLTMIQAHAKGSIFNASPAGSGTAMAGLVADRVLTTFGPHALHKAISIRDRYHQQVHDIANSGGDMSKQSSQRVSDECVGEMLADRFVLWKEAGVSQDLVRSAKKGGSGAMKMMATKGARNFGDGLAFFSSALALAGLVHGAGHLMDERKKKQLDAEANNAFAQVSKKSEIIQGNPVVAAEAFDAIKSFAPTLATKPNVLRSFVEHTIGAQGHMPTQTVNDLATTQSNVNKAKGPGFAHGFFGALTPALNSAKTITSAGDE